MSDHSHDPLYKFWCVTGTNDYPTAGNATTDASADGENLDSLLGDLMVRLSCGHFSDFLPMASVQMFNKFSHQDANLDSPEDSVEDNEEQWQIALDQEEYKEFQTREDKIKSILSDLHHPVCVVTSKCEKPADYVDNFIAEVEDAIHKTDLLNQCIQQKVMIVLLVIKMI